MTSKRTPQQLPWNSIWTGIALAVVLATDSGCAKLRARSAMDCTDRLLTEARTFNAERHVKTELDRAVAKRNEAEDLLTRREFKQSLAAAQQAERSSREALTKARQMETAKQMLDADRDVACMNQNSGGRENPELRQKTIEAQTKMNQAWRSENWENAIALAREIKANVEQVLLPLPMVGARSVLEEALKEADAWLQKESFEDAINTCKTALIAADIAERNK